MGHKIDRRRFLHGMFGSVGAILAARAGWLFPEAQKSPARPLGIDAAITKPQFQVAGELYAGFLLLPEDVQPPSTVKYPENWIPSVCGVGNADIAPTTSKVVTESFATPSDLAKNARLPMYHLRKMSDGLRSATVYLMRDSSGSIYVAWVNYESYVSATSRWDNTVSIWAQPNYPRPFPLWSSSPVEPGGPSIALEKVSFLPTPGIQVSTKQGYVFYWIENAVLYTLVAENNPSREEAQILAGTLTPVKGFA